jgi:hypothetical protein
MRADLRPFQIAVPGDALSERKERLARTRWPEAGLHA